jgi:hypothetical protein
VTWYPHDLLVHLPHTGSQQDPVLQHPKLQLKLNVDYRASVMVWTNSANQGAELALELHDAPSPQLRSAAVVPTVPLQTVALAHHNTVWSRPRQ